MHIFFKKRANILQNSDKKLRNTIIVAGIVSIIAYVILFIFSQSKPVPYSDEMLGAARIMQNAISVIRDYCDQSGIEIDSAIDPNQTGLVGPEYSELTTTIGHLEAKRTTTNPNIASLIVHLLYQAEVQPGDIIAVGSSASFPALMIASLAATQAMDVYPIVIISLGASSYGGTKINFNLLDLYNLLLNENVITVKPAAISLGGEKDTGQDYEPDMRKHLMEQIQSSGIPFIYESKLQKNVTIRMKIYESHSSEKRISAFINTGGSYSNLGTSKLVLALKPGLNKKVHIPPEDQRGVLFDMAAQGTPVIHLLNIKGLSMRYGLPWDPIPLPKPGEGEFVDKQALNNIQFWLITIIYFAMLFMLTFYRRVIKSNKTLNT